MDAPISKKSKRGPICAVPTCKNPVDASYHSFPKDTSLQRAWIAVCKRKDPINVKNAKVCGHHFKEEDFERHLQVKLGLSRPLRRLRDGVIPSINLPTLVKAKANHIHTTCTTSTSNMSASVRNMLRFPVERREIECIHQNKELLKQSIRQKEDRAFPEFIVSEKSTANILSPEPCASVLRKFCTQKLMDNCTCLNHLCLSLSKSCLI